MTARRHLVEEGCRESVRSKLGARLIIPVSQGAHRDCRWIKAPRFAIDLSANPASWSPPRSYCWGLRQGWRRHCCILVARLGFPLLHRMWGSLPWRPEEAATEGAVWWTSGPRPKSASQGLGKEAAACVQVSGAQVGCGPATRSRQGHTLSDPRHCSAAGCTRGALGCTLVAGDPRGKVNCRRGPPGCAPWAESWSLPPVYRPPVLQDPPATEARSATNSLEKGSMVAGRGRCSQICLHVNLSFLGL